MTNWGAGTPRRELLHVDDLASACLFLLENFDGPNRVNVGTGIDHTIAEIADMVATAVGYTSGTRRDWMQPERDTAPIAGRISSAGRGMAARDRLALRHRGNGGWYRANASAARR